MRFILLFFVYSLVLCVFATGEKNCEPISHLVRKGEVYVYTDEIRVILDDINLGKIKFFCLSNNLVMMNGKNSVKTSSLLYNFQVQTMFEKKVNKPLNTPFGDFKSQYYYKPKYMDLGVFKIDRRKMLSDEECLITLSKTNKRNKAIKKREKKRKKNNVDNPVNLKEKEERETVIRKLKDLQTLLGGWKPIVLKRHRSKMNIEHIIETSWVKYQENFIDPPEIVGLSNQVIMDINLNSAIAGKIERGKIKKAIDGLLTVGPEYFLYNMEIIKRSIKKLRNQEFTLRTNKSGKRTLINKVRGSENDKEILSELNKKLKVMEENGKGVIVLAEEEKGIFEDFKAVYTNKMAACIYSLDYMEEVVRNVKPPWKI